jgi:hypothetical protein
MAIHWWHDTIPDGRHHAWGESGPPGAGTALLLAVSLIFMVSARAVFRRPRPASGASMRLPAALAR